MKVIASFFFALILAGCANRNSGVTKSPADSGVAEASKVNEIIVGKTTRAEVDMILGKPMNEMEFQNGKTYFYRYRGPEEALHPSRSLPSLAIHFDKDLDKNLIVAKTTVSDATTGTIRILGQIPSDPPIHASSTNATLLCYGQPQAETIDRIRPDVTLANDTHGNVMDILNFGSVGHGQRYNEFHQLISLTPGKHEIGMLLIPVGTREEFGEPDTRFWKDPRPEELGYENFDFEAGKEYRIVLESYKDGFQLSIRDSDRSRSPTEITNK